MTIPDSEPSVNAVAHVLWVSNKVVSVENVIKTNSCPSRPHPPYMDMVVEAVKTLKNRRGTSLQAIKKYIQDIYPKVNVAVPRTSNIINRALNTAVEKGTLVLILGKGSSKWYKLGKLTEKSKVETRAINLKADSNVEKPTKSKSEKAKTVKVTKPKNKKSAASINQKDVTNEKETARKVTPKLNKAQNNTLAKLKNNGTESTKVVSTAKTGTKTKASTEKVNLVVAAKGAEKRSRFEDLVVEAIKNLKSRRGSSLQVIKKYLNDTHQVNVLRSSRFIVKAIHVAVENGTLVRTSGRGASGSFKLGEPVKKSISKTKATKVDSSVENHTKLKNEEAPTEKVTKPEKKEPASSKKTETQTKQKSPQEEAERTEEKLAEKS